MRFLVDECTGPAVASWLRAQGHEVFSVFEQARGMTDDEVIERACAERWILITIDKDFGEMVHRQGRRHEGVVLLRLQDERGASKIAALELLLRTYPNQLAGRFVVVTEAQVRIGR